MKYLICTIIISFSSLSLGITTRKPLIGLVDEPSNLSFAAYVFSEVFPNNKNVNDIKLLPKKIAKLENTLRTSRANLLIKNLVQLIDAKLTLIKIYPRSSMANKTNDWKNLVQQTLKNINQLVLLSKNQKLRNEMLSKAVLLHFANSDYSSARQKFSLLDTKNLNQNTKIPLLIGNMLAEIIIETYSQKTEEKINILKKNLLKFKSDFQVLTHLEIAKYYKVQQNSRYRNELQLASSLCQSFSKQQKELILGEIINTWILAFDFNNNWLATPFKIKNFQGLFQIVGLAERMALQSLNEKNYPSAIKIFDFVLANSKDEKIRSQIYKDMFFINKAQYAINQIDANTWQNFMISVDKKINDSNKNLAIDSEQQHILRTETQKLNQSTSYEQIDAIKKIIHIWLKNREFNQASEDVLNLVATKFSEIDKYADAIQIYKLLSNLAPLNKRNKYLQNAIELQAKIANWNLNDPWSEQPAGLSYERKKLLSDLYEQEKLSDNKPNWNRRANIGQLEIALGKTIDGLAILQRTIIEQPDHLFARRALFEMMDQAKRENNWQWLENLAYIAMQNNIEPLSKDKIALDVNSNLEYALFEGAKKEISRQRPQIALDKLITLTSSYFESNNYSHYLFLLAHSYEIQGQYTQAIETLKSVLNLSANVPYYKESLIKAIDLSIGMADLEQSIVLCDLFMEKFPNEKITFAFKRLELLFALDKRKEFNQSLTEINLNQLSADQKNLVFSMLFSIYRAENDYVREEDLAKSLLKFPDTATDLKYISLKTLVKSAFSKRNMNDLLAYKPLINQLDIPSKHQGEINSYISHLEATMDLEEAIETFKNDLVKNDQYAMINLFSKLPKAYEKFLSSCQSTYPVYCQNSSQVFSLMINNLKDISKQNFEKSDENTINWQKINTMLADLTQSVPKAKLIAPQLPSEEMNGRLTKIDINQEQHEYAGLGYVQWYEKN